MLDANDMLQAQGTGALSASLGLAKPFSVSRSEPATQLPFQAAIAGKLLQNKAPEREWFIFNRIPLRHVCLLSGDGGLGKSTLALQLGIAAATGTSWLGCDVRRAKVAILSAEDELAEMHFRIEKQVDWLVKMGQDRERITSDLNSLFLFDATSDLDPGLASFTQKKALEPTSFFGQLSKFILDNDIGLLILDSAADVFNEEIDRSAVRSFIRLLRGLTCTVLLLTHPSAAGLKNGTGRSGSTHWSNSVRSRFLLERPLGEEGAIADQDKRILTMPKNNRGPVGQKLNLLWTPAGFICEAGSDESGIRIDPKIKFMALLQEFERTGQTVSPNRSSAYAPAVFAKHPAAGGITKRGFEIAMQSLLTEGSIVIVDSDGPPSKRTKVIKMAEANHACE